jgi:hypothetical protein
VTLVAPDNVRCGDVLGLREGFGLEGGGVDEGGGAVGGDGEEASWDGEEMGEVEGGRFLE